MAYIAVWNEWRGMMGSSQRPISVEKLGRALGEPQWMAPTVSLGVRTKMVGNRTQDGRFTCQLEKMEVLLFFLQLKQAFFFAIVSWDSISHGNWGKLGPFETTENKDQ